MDWADKRVRTNFIHLNSQLGADIAVLHNTAGEQPEGQYNPDLTTDEWDDYLFIKGIFFLYSNFLLLLFTFIYRWTSDGTTRGGGSCHEEGTTRLQTIEER